MIGYITVCHRSFWLLSHFTHSDTFIENNTDSAADEVDLHGLYVAEAV